MYIVVFSNQRKVKLFIKMKILKAENSAIKQCATLLQNNHLVAFPTETVYGLGANAYCADAVIKIFKTKNRPLFNPLIVHYANFESCFKDVKVTKTAQILANAFLPGPLTLVLERTDDSKITELCSNGLKSQAIRVPNNKYTRQLISLLNFPLAGPSANSSNMLSPTSCQHVLKSLKNSDITILEDENACKAGLESTVVDARNEEYVSILRNGPIAKEDIEKLVKVKENKEENTIAPGMQKKHYSPNKPLTINVVNPKNDEAYLCFGKYCKNEKNHFCLSKTSLDEAGKNLFKMLWELDESNYNSIAISPIPKTGIGLAINDRITRASYKR